MNTLSNEQLHAQITRQGGLSQALFLWTRAIATQLPTLARPQARVLALWSLGMILAQSCGLFSVALFLATAFSQPENTLRQCLREFYLEAEAKKGDQRQQVEVTTCFAPLLQWVLDGWQSDRLALALAATHLGQRFIVLSVSVLYRGCAIPVAWTILPALAKNAWRPHWLRMLRQLRPAGPPRMKVIVLADRGLYAKWRFRRIVRLKWHPMLRINLQGRFCPDGSNRYVPWKGLVGGVGASYQARGVAFKNVPGRLRCTLLGYWGEGCMEPWLVVTDLGVECGGHGWYGLRSWIECGFKIIKSKGWQWQRTRMKESRRAERLWLGVAVATLWVVSVGGVAEEAVEGQELAAGVVARRRRSGTQWRLHGLYQRGLAVIVVGLMKQEINLPGGIVDWFVKTKFSPFLKWSPLLF